MFFRKNFAALALISMLAGGVSPAVLAGPKPKSSKKNVATGQAVHRVTSVEGITEYRLDNGLKVLLFPDQSKETITVNITYLVGSRHENYGETGMAHLLEHLMFKGSKNHTAIPKELDERGARYNASTWLDRTNYYESIPASEGNLDWALGLEADRMVNSFIAKKDLDSEMTVVRNEFEDGENNPVAILNERVTSTMYLWHNYGHSTIGARSDIEQVPITRLQAFYRNYYQPDNAVLLVAGKFDEAKALALIQAKFGTIPRPTRTLQPTYTVEPTQDGERTVTLRRVGDTQAVCAAYHVPAGAHPDFAAISVLNLVLTDTPSGRLHKALVETKKAAQVGGELVALHDACPLTLIAVVPKDSPIDAARETMIRTIDGAVAEPPTKEEVDRARLRLLKQIELNLNSSEDVGLELSEWIAQGDWRLLFLYRDRLRAVTPDDVKRVAAAYLKPSNRTLGIFIPTDKPDRAEIPTRPNVAELVRDYKGDAAIAAGEAFDPSPVNIDARTTRVDAPGGLKLALLPKKTRGGTVFASLTLRFGDEKSLMNLSSVAELTGAMLMRGTAKHTRQQIQDELDKLKARMSVTGQATAVAAGIETTRENLPGVLRLLAEVLREPSFPQAELDQLKTQAIDQAEQQKSEPQAVAGIALSRYLSSMYPRGDVRYVETPDEEIADIKAVTTEQMKKFHADFYGASRGEFAVVGDFDDKEITKLVSELFGDWKSAAPYARVSRPFAEAAPINQSFETPDKANAFFVAALRMKLRDDDPDFPALVITDYILGGNPLNSRLGDRIRQKDGLSYFVGTQLQVDSFDPAGALLAFAIYNPENVAKLETAFREEIARLVKDGVTEKELAAAKAGLMQARQVSRAQDGELAGRLAQGRYLNRTMAWDADLDKKYAALTVEQVTAAIRRHIDPTKFNIVKAGDFAKVKK